MKQPECIYIPKEYFSYFKKFLKYAKGNSNLVTDWDIPVKTAFKLFLFSKFLENQDGDYNYTELTKDGDKVMLFFTLSNLTDPLMNTSVLNTDPIDYPDGDLLLFINKRVIVDRERIDLERRQEDPNDVDDVRLKITNFNLKEDFQIHQKNLKTIGSQINFPKLKRMVESNETLRNKNFKHWAIPIDYYTGFNKLINEFKVKNPYMKLEKGKKMDDFEINTLKSKSNFGSIDW